MVRRNPATTDPRPTLEAHSYEHVPVEDRHGTAIRQAPFWFMVNATLITLLTGAIGPGFGLGLGWTCLAVVTGSVFGTFFQAFHAAQGPHLGLPQMIQSRVQFGSRGAVVPLLAALMVAGGFSVFNIQFAAASLAQVTIPHSTLFQWLLTLVGVVLAVVGYDLLHRMQTFLSVFALLNLVLLTVAVATQLPLQSLLSSGAFVGTGFIAQFGASAAYQIAIAPIVSDYTRYLPVTTRTGSVVAAVFGGTLLSAVWIELLGAAIGSARPGQDVVAAIAGIGNDFGFGLGDLTLGVAAVVLTAVYATSIYSTVIAFLSALEAFFPFDSTAAIRALCVVVAGALTLGAGLLMTSDVLTNFSGFLSILLYLLIPWTAVNLVDYYVVRRGAYSITDILEQDGGIYGRWNRRGIVSYAVAFAAMVPFMNTALFEGPVASALDGADVAPLVGLAVGGALYYAQMLRVDLSEEMRVVATRPVVSPGLDATPAGSGHP